MEKQFQLKIPNKLKNILIEDPELNGIIETTIAKFSELFHENKLYFFEEYTDHGIRHIQQVLNACNNIISIDTFRLLSSKDIGILILGVLLHDLGMHTSYETFKSMIGGQYDDDMIKEIDKKSWSSLWKEYLNEAKRFNSKQRKNILGDEYSSFNILNLEKKINNLEKQDPLDDYEKKIIGEFLRRHHPRIAHEIACIGIASKGIFIDFSKELDDYNKSFKKIAGIVARSHGMKVRDTFDYLKTISEGGWARSYDIHIIFLMAVLRIADYFQITNERLLKFPLKFKTFSSPISSLEHLKHTAIEFAQQSTNDVETLYVESKPNNSLLHLKLKELFEDIQNELDLSWAILGEIYGRIDDKKRPKLVYRRIISNLDSNYTFSNTTIYVPEKFSFATDDELSKLLIKPLYGNNPSYGVRELLQNSIDSCLERNLEENIDNVGNYIAVIKINVWRHNSDYFFQITDNGRGMNTFEIKNYFLKVGASFRKSKEWNDRFTNDKGESIVQRTGKFGIGVLATFLIGDQMEVKTKSTKEKYGYTFTTNLDTEQIEMNKDEMLSDGTGIKIKISKEVYDIFIEEASLRDNSSKNWLGWFTLKYPAIIYAINGVEVSTKLFRYNPSPNKKLPNDCYIIEPKEYDKVIWTYGSKYHSGKLSCNGIVIPNEYKFNFEYILSTGLNIREPNVMIYDSNGNLELSLNRNSLSKRQLPFERMLVEDIIKNIIASIFHLTNHSFIEDNILKISKIEFYHPAITNGLYTNIDFLFLRDGFIINNSFCINKLYDKHKYDLLHTFIFPNDINSSIKIPDNFKIIRLKKITKGLPYQSHKTTMMSNELFDELTKISGAKKFDVEESHVYNRINENEITVLDKNDYYVIFTYHDTDKPTFTLNTFGNQKASFDCLTEEEIAKYMFNDNNSLFETLLSEYLGDNIIIPYDFEKRKKMYKKIFNEIPYH